MVSPITTVLINFFEKRGKLALIIQALIFFALTFTVAGLSLNTFLSSETQLTSQLSSQRLAIVNLASRVTKERLDRILDVGLSFTNQKSFRGLVKAKDWHAAISLMSSVPINFPTIERVFITDPDGTELADTPERPGAIGRNFAFRDWYQGVVSTRNPYLSEVYKRAAEPQINVVAIAIPIKDDDQSIMGILVLQIKLDTIFAWSQELNIGQSTTIYITDQHGKIAAHPEYPPQGLIKDFSSMPAVSKALMGEQNVEILRDNEANVDDLVAYSPINGYGWTVVVEQPVEEAFRFRNQQLMNVMTSSGILLILTGAWSLTIYKLVRTLSSFRQRERALLQSAGDGLIAIDLGWNITLWNAAAEKITGWKSSEALGKQFRDVVKFIKQEDRSESIDFIAKAMATGKVASIASSDHIILIRKDRTEISIGDSAAPLIDSDGKVQGAIIVFRDISEEEGAEALRSDFAYASHQLRTPITKALWSLEVLKNEKLARNVKTKIEIAYNSLKSVEQLSSGLVVISELDQNMVIPETAQVKLVPLIKKVISETSDIVKKYGVRLVFAKDLEKEDLKLKTDEKLLAQILSRIVDNAIRYNNKGGEVEISFTRQDGNVLIEIRDNGIGIPLPEQPFTFIKFYRGSNFDSTEIEGAGLSLPISKRYAELLGGNIWFKSKEGDTRFYVQLPINR